MWDGSAMQHLYLNKYKFFFTFKFPSLIKKNVYNQVKWKKNDVFIVLNKSCKLYTI